MLRGDETLHPYLIHPFPQTSHVLKHFNQHTCPAKFIPRSAIGVLHSFPVLSHPNVGRALNDRAIQTFVEWLTSIKLVLCAAYSIASSLRPQCLLSNWTVYLYAFVATAYWMKNRDMLRLERSDWVATWREGQWRLRATQRKNSINSEWCDNSCSYLR